MTIHEGSDDQALDLELRGDEKPLCSEEECAPGMREFVAYEALQVFALVEEYGERADGRIVAFPIACGFRRERRPARDPLVIDSP